MDDGCNIIGEGELKDLAAIVLGGYTIAEIIAIISEGVHIAKSVVESVLNGLIPMIIPTEQLDLFRDFWRQQQQGGIRLPDKIYP